MGSSNPEIEVELKERLQQLVGHCRQAMKEIALP
jgi:hypothetical protein